MDYRFSQRLIGSGEMRGVKKQRASVIHLQAPFGTRKLAVLQLLQSLLATPVALVKLAYLTG